MPIGAYAPATLSVVPRGHHGDPGNDGAPGDQISFNTLAAATAATIASGVQHVRTAGYGTVGDGGHALYYKRGSTPVPAQAWHFQSADGAWWQMAAGDVLNGVALGAKGDNATSNNAALAAIRTAIDEGLWSRCRLPPGKYRFSQWDLSDLDTFIIEGDYGMDLGHTGRGTCLIYTGSGAGPAISINNSRGLQFRDLALTYSSATYTGKLFDADCDDSTWSKIRFDNVHFYQLGASTYSATLFSGYQVVDALFVGCRFSHGARGVIGSENSQSSASSGRFTFVGCDSVYLDVPFGNPGLTWCWLGHSFEPNSDGFPAGIYVYTGGSNILQSPGVFGSSFSDANGPGEWVGTMDVNWTPAAGTAPNMFGGGFFGSSFAGDIDGADPITAINVNSAFGAAFTGILFSGVDKALKAGGLSEVIVAGNSYPNTTTPISGFTNLEPSSIVGGNNVNSQMALPTHPPSYTVGTVPAAASYPGGMIYVTNETGGAVIAFSNGVSWLRVTDRAVIS